MSEVEELKKELKSAKDYARDLEDAILQYTRVRYRGRVGVAKGTKCSEVIEDFLYEYQP